MGWIYVVLGGVLELLFTLCLRYVNGFRNIPWTVAFFIILFTSMYLITAAIKTIPLGTAYAVWTGIGTMGTAIIGIIWYNEPATAARLIFILMIVAGAIGLKVTSGH